ncbi:related to ATP-dependent RNA helicase [Cephalotrichum gorgonifer]|uniref:RNA helicase n=1 Tax=Cephalotrichum gorgonifer TaxID=2041049 RepID=A0AAE8ST19_9PEZI|nr:related to ATP-dependent RNA helicase [Cephalotrichum gorgonifer]
MNSAAWGTSSMKEALPDSTAEHSTVSINGHGNDAAAAAAPAQQDSKQWIKPRAYDYTAMDGPDQNSPWDGSAAVYEWDGEGGDVGPEYPDLEVELFGKAEDRKEGRGVDFTAIAEIEVVQEGPVKIDRIDSFRDAGLHPVMLRNVELAGFEAPTPIQKYTLPSIHLGYDTIGIAQTGSGKTAAYLIPILSKLMGKAKKLAAPRPNPATYQEGVDRPYRAEPLVVIVAPTRELATQIFNEARKFCYRTMLRPCVCYGGGPIGEQVRNLGKGCDILVATPGRLLDFMKRPQVLSMSRVRYMVIDEADEMLQVDWEEEMGYIMSGANQDEGNVRYLLFSATFPKPLRDLAKLHLAANHVRFRVGRAGSTHGNIKQEVLYVDANLKRDALTTALKSIDPCRTIVFVNSKRTADDLDDYLFNMDMPCTSMHSDRTQAEREAAMRGFRSGEAPILITTAVTARGIDVRHVRHVINYDLPSMDHGGIEEYIHRIGRTGRIGHRGLATSFFTDGDEAIGSVLTRTLLETNQEIPDFLKHHVPEEGQDLKFEADSDFDPNEGQGAQDGDAWGSGGNAGWGNEAGNDADAGADAGWM